VATCFDSEMPSSLQSYAGRSAPPEVLRFRQPKNTRCSPFRQADAFADKSKAWFIQPVRVGYDAGIRITQSSSDTDKVSAILDCHPATGRIGNPGIGPFSVTGYPNAVGGMANMRACHLDLENVGHRAGVQTFWNSPEMAQYAHVLRPGQTRADAICLAIRPADLVAVSNPPGRAILGAVILEPAAPGQNVRPES